ncbi:MAG: transposase, partial [Cyanobacteria bacterium P01_A01_bin.45]
MLKRDIQGKFALKNDDYRQVRSVRLVYSQRLAASAIRGQQQRINSAQTALNKLVAKPGEDPQQLAHKVENILERYRVKNFFSTRITEQIIQQTRHVKRGRPSKNSPTQEITNIRLQLHVQQIDAAIKEAETLAG